MDEPQARRFEARFEQFPELRAHAERCCLDAGLERGPIDRMVLVLEELFANTVEHGYARAPDAGGARPVWLTVQPAMGRIEVVYEDAAPAHDPFSRAATPDYSGPVDTWQVGGLGVALVIRLGRNVRYERLENRNRVCFTILSAASGA